MQIGLVILILRYQLLDMHFSLEDQLSLGQANNLPTIALSSIEVKYQAITKGMK
jgi:hypothetical protein